MAVSSALAKAAPPARIRVSRRAWQAGRRTGRLGGSPSSRAPRGRRPCSDARGQRIASCPPSSSNLRITVIERLLCGLPSHSVGVGNDTPLVFDNFEIDAAVRQIVALRVAHDDEVGAGPAAHPVRRGAWCQGSGTNHCLRSLGSVHALKTLWRGASMMRVNTSSRSDVGAASAVAVIRLPVGSCRDERVAARPTSSAETLDVVGTAWSGYV
jgi:hypothetical protein